MWPADGQPIGQLWKVPAQFPGLSAISFTQPDHIQRWYLHLKSKLISCVVRFWLFKHIMYFYLKMCKIYRVRLQIWTQEIEQRAQQAQKLLNAARHQRLTEEFAPFLAIYYYLSQFIDCPSGDSSIAATVVQRRWLKSPPTDVFFQAVVIVDLATSEQAAQAGADHCALCSISCFQIWRRTRYYKTAKGLCTPEFTIQVPVLELVFMGCILFTPLVPGSWA